jgi:hypothetical protein
MFVPIVPLLNHCNAAAPINLPSIFLQPLVLRDLLPLYQVIHCCHLFSTVAALVPGRLVNPLQRFSAKQPLVLHDPLDPLQPLVQHCRYQVICCCNDLYLVDRLICNSDVIRCCNDLLYSYLVDRLVRNSDVIRCCNDLLYSYLVDRLIRNSDVIRCCNDLLYESKTSLALW